MDQLVRTAFLCLLLSGVLLSSAGLLHAQTVTYTGAAVDFGEVYICTPGKTTPAPCRETLTLKYSVTAGGTLGTPRVLTLGAPNLDFTPAGSTCTGSVTTGSSCIVQVTFAPKFPGMRAGAVQITDGNESVLATTYLRGVGRGPQIVIDGALPTTVVTYPNLNIFWGGIALDGAGNVFLPNGERVDEGVQPAVFEFPAGGGALRTVGAGFVTPQAVALDGAGNLYVTDIGNNLVVEVPPGCANVNCQITLDGGFDFPFGITVDGAGNVYVADSGNSRVVEFPAGCATRSCAIAIGSGWNFPTAVAVDGAGNVFIADDDFRVVRVPAGGGAPVTVVNNLLLSSVAVDAAGDLFMTDGYDSLLLEAPAGGGALIALAHPVHEPLALALDGAGNIFFTNFFSSNVVSELQRGQVPVQPFATAAVGTTSSDSPQAYTVQNGGNMVLSLTGLTVGTDSNFIQVAGPGVPSDCKVSISLAPGASCDLSLSFAPTANGPLAGVAVLTDNTLNASDATQMIPLAGTGGPAGPAISFPNGFSASSGLSLTGGATLNGSTLQLTDGGPYESRGAFFSGPIGLASFTTAFDFQLTGKETMAPDADGFAFVLQANGPDALGSAGGGLGYGLPGEGQSGPKITNSVAVKFDLHNNNGEGTSSTGLYLNGASPTVPSINLLPSNIDLHSGHVFHVMLVYDGSNLTLTIKDQTTNATFSQKFPVNIAGFLGGQTGYAGFTASTGLETAVQNILDWQLVSSACCMTGEPVFPGGFSAASDLTLNGDAAISGGALQLTQDTAFETSSAFFSTAVPVNRFTSDFDFKLSHGDGDGFAFVLQSQGLNAIGPGGGGLGYGPETPGGVGGKIGHSVAVKFDLHSDAGEGSNSTGLYIGGASPTVPSTNLTPSGINLHSGHTFHARLNYDGVNLTISITDLTQYAIFTGAYAVKVTAAVGGTNAFAGFTAGTGSLYDTVQIFNWNMTSY